jgi:hypothetical protein
MNNTGDTTAPELVTRQSYYIANQSNLELTVTYKIAHTNIDSTVIVPADSTTKIFGNGGVGSSSTPSSSFAKLNFYKSSVDSTVSPLFTIEPIVSDNWDLTPGNPAKYTLVITGKDLN